MSEILIAAIVLGGLGLVLGGALAIASMCFHVDIDDRIIEISKLVPGANCGGCGYSGCEGYAKAIVNDGAPINSCFACSQDAVNKIASIMGVETKNAKTMKAVVNCCGDESAAHSKFDYYGIETCEAAAKFSGGPKSCQFSCVGLGSCLNACNYNAIEIIDNLAKVHRNRCIGCGACVTQCPKGVLQLIDINQMYNVGCSSRDTGKDTIKLCSVGCIACGICVKVCPNGAISIIDNLAVIDYESCIRCGLCAEKCPRKIIKKIK
ncbi:MAG: RnfABCDGE type electron transport complex subunit B [Eubacteriales bacterium]|nr:RnfABCDGE type electron transport complex subunit B [Eubacteriales bacterium]